jgi:hypothetical protein
MYETYNVWTPVMHKRDLGQEPLKPRTMSIFGFLENQLAISFLRFDISYR